MIRPGRPNYSGVTATLALIIALSGTSYAAVTVAKGSVGTAQLKNGAVTAPKLDQSAVTAKKIKNQAVTSAKVKNGTITPGDLSVNAVRKAVGGVRAAGLVSSGGSISRALNASVTKAGTGVYCITPDPAVVPDVTTAVVLATVDYSSATGYTAAQIRSSGIGCGAGELTIRTWNVSQDNTEIAEDAGFSFVVL